MAERSEKKKKDEWVRNEKECWMFLPTSRLLERRKKEIARKTRKCNK